MIFDALKDPNSSQGLDVGEIVRYIEVSHRLIISHCIDFHHIIIWHILSSSVYSKNFNDLVDFYNFLQERYEAPPNLKKIIGPKLRTLASRGKLSKVIYFLHLLSLH